ncbi:hypothetical protein ACTXT7_010192 [Hymenolepis weldensis]
MHGHALTAMRCRCHGVVKDDNIRSNGTASASGSSTASPMWPKAKTSASVSKNSDPNALFGREGYIAANIRGYKLTNV